MGVLSHQFKMVVIVAIVKMAYRCSQIVQMMMVMMMLVVVIHRAKSTRSTVHTATAIDIFFRTHTYGHIVVIIIIIINIVVVAMQRGRRRIRMKRRYLNGCLFGKWQRSGTLMKWLDRVTGCCDHVILWQSR